MDGSDPFLMDEELLAKEAALVLAALQEAHEAGMPLSSFLWSTTHRLICELWVTSAP